MKYYSEHRIASDGGLKSIPELCEDRKQRKIQREAMLNLCQTLALRYLTQWSKLIDTFKSESPNYPRTVSPVDIIVGMEEAIKNYQKSVKDSEIDKWLSEFEIKEIWKNTAKKIRKEHRL